MAEVAIVSQVESSAQQWLALALTPGLGGARRGRTGAGQHAGRVSLLLLAPEDHVNAVPVA